MACFYLNSVYAQNLWQAQHHSKRYVVLLKKTNTELDTIFLSIPEQGYESVPLLVKVKNDSLVAENNRYGFKLKAKAFDGNMVPSIVKNNSNTPFYLNFKPVDSIEPLYFPQHPIPPLPYFVKHVKFNGKETGLTYGGTLTLPKGKKKYPLAVLVSGTGKQDRDYKYSGHQFFTVLADWLARNGIASLRVDDRGEGETTGDFSLATSLDFANDLHEACTYLNQQSNIDTSFLGVIGHSEGGMIASIETSRNKDVKFMVSLSGIAVSGFKNLELQNKAILQSFDISDSLVVKYMELYKTMFRTVYNFKEGDSLELNLTHAVNAFKKQQDSTVLKALQLLDGRDLTLIYRYGKEAKTNWYKYMIHYNPKVFLSKINIPVLALNGDADINVIANENLNGFKTYLPTTTDLTLKSYPKLNHMYQHCDACTTAEIPEIDEVFAPEVLEDISKWINRKFKNQ
ncbi:alpha/beta hydrolase family protein [Confluentibacter sediminis]|uniref:alpha/beta hydrolase family protein n=1 Tax=Confluentibacter sediminis TaxID=2219045 RepID=UPI0013A6B141|nr:alpha/beta hydrolase [Confluentibacter sediminis]